MCSGLAVIGVGYFAKKYRAALGRFKDHIRRYVGASVLGTNAVAAAIGSIAQQGHYDRFIVSSADRLKHATVRMNLKGYQKRRAEQVISSYKKTLLMTSSLVNTPLAHLANLDRGLLDQYGMKWMNTLGYTALAFLGVLGWGFARKAERLSVIPDVKGAMRSASDWAQEKIKGLSPHRRRQRRCVAVFN
ncbi:MAG: hypothetical protein CL675_05310 [Bdellovibrionaceae bacterium]|nr:hypothetical protein [Pseudobdellovibrionaceae bacterium]